MPTAGAFSDFVEDAIAKQYFRNTAPATPPATVYVAAFTAVPTDVAGSGTEVSAAGTAYARQAVSCGTSGTGVGAGWAFNPHSTHKPTALDVGPRLRTIIRVAAGAARAGASASAGAYVVAHRASVPAPIAVQRTASGAGESAASSTTAVTRERCASGATTCGHTASASAVAVRNMSTASAADGGGFAACNPSNAKGLAPRAQRVERVSIATRIKRAA